MLAPTQFEQSEADFSEAFPQTVESSQAAVAQQMDMGPEVEMDEADIESEAQAQRANEGEDDDDDEEDNTFEYAEMGYEKLDDCDEESFEAEQGSSEDVDTSAVTAPIISVQTEQLIASGALFILFSHRVDGLTLTPKEDLDAIKSVMSAIAMPESAVPDWAKSIPEALWLPKVEVKPAQSHSDEVAR
ncbi:hypothetical protein HDU81_011043 [Chytriomyces hyalinus]|nr:hypothetical protein HDU81_011043 [Chytriomyces hyalinus]